MFLVFTTAPQRDDVDFDAMTTPVDIPGYTYRDGRYFRTVRSHERAYLAPEAIAATANRAADDVDVDRRRIISDDSTTTRGGAGAGFLAVRALCVASGESSRAGVVSRGARGGVRGNHAGGARESGERAPDGSGGVRARGSVANKVYARRAFPSARWIAYDGYRAKFSGEFE